MTNTQTNNYKNVLGWGSDIRSWRVSFPLDISPTPYNEKDMHTPTEDIQTQHKRCLRDPCSHTKEGGEAGAHLGGGGTGKRKLHTFLKRLGFSNVGGLQEGRNEGGDVLSREHQRSPRALTA